VLLQMRMLIAVLLVAGAPGFGRTSVANLKPGADSVMEIQGSRKPARLRFDLGAVPAGNAIVGARLLLRLEQIGSQPPIDPKRFAVSVGDTHIANLVVKAAGECSVDLTRHARAVLEVRHSDTAPAANAGGDVFQKPGDAGAMRVDGGNSALPDGSRAGLRYEWSVERPAWGSPHRAGEKLSSAAVLSFLPKAPGWYTLKLRVANPATGEFTEDTAHVMTPLRPHPRLQVDERVLARIRALRDAKDPLWERFYSRLKSRPAAGGQGMQANLWTARAGW
jgi:hypothetical protein